MSSLPSRSTYQSQLRRQHLYNSTISKQHVLAKYWIESILGHRLPSNDLQFCLRDGFYLCKILQIIQNDDNDTTVDYHDNYQLPDDRIHHFLKSAQEFGLQSSDLFSVNDLMNGENMNAVVSTILILAHTYSCKRFAGKSNISTTPLPKSSQSYSFQLDQIQQEQQQAQQQNIVRSKSETLISNNKRMKEHNTITGDINHEQGSKEKKECNISEERYTGRGRKGIVAPITTTTNNNTSLINHYINKALPNSPRNSGSNNNNKWDPPFDFQRPNCIPGYGPYSLANFRDEEEEEDEKECMLSSSPPSPIDSFDEEDMYNTKKSNTPSSSGDSGYGTTTARKSNFTNNNNNNNKKVQDLFEALFAPVAPPPTAQPPPSLKIHPNNNNNTVSHSGGNSKLSLLFSSSKKNDQPHYVKFQTWSNNQKQQQKPSTTVTNLSTPIKKGKQQHHHNENDGSIRRPHEEYLFKSTNHKRSSSSNNRKMTSEDWCKYLEQEQQTQLLLPPIIKVEKKEEFVEQPPLLKKQLRSRRRTDASLVRIIPPESILNSATAKPKHARCKSIGSTLDIKSPTTPNMSSPIDTSNILEHCDEDGNLIARYKLGNVIGKGHFGTVYRALDLMSGKTVAIKQISLKDSRKSDIEDMMQEAALLSSLTHINIVKYEGFIQTHEHMNIVLEFVENGSLLNTLKSFGNALPEHLVASYCHHILQGLAYLHKQDVVHCDLKAANILTTKAGDVKLSDFGVSLNLKLKNHEDNLVSGTPFWMSPEVIELKGASVQSDIWSLGCTVIELCTGRPPYADLITMTAMFKIVEDDCPPLPTDISDDLHNFLKLCFKKNPIERPTAEHLLYHPWITNNNSTTPIMSPITPVTKSNSTILNNYLQKMTKKDDMIMLDNINTCSHPIPRGSNSMKVMSPSSAPYYSPITTTLPPPPPLPAHSLSPNTQRQYDLPTFQSKSLFVNKFNQRQHGAGSILARQSMPIVANQYQQPKQQDNTTPSPHVHNLIECSFPKGAGQCKVCNNHIKHDALVCKDFCGYICHKQCKSFNGGRRRASDQTSPLLSGGGPKPMLSVSSQLREKFSFSKILLSSKPQQRELGDITEDHNTIVSPTLKSKSSSWWKKKQ